MDFADGLVRHSSHEIDLRIMPARFWKWRMRGAALHFVRTLKHLNAYDALICTSLMSLADFKSLCNDKCPPALVYFHENQLTYPVGPEAVRDVHFGFTDITTALAADRILFNSKTHFSNFFDYLPGFIRMMPDFRPKWVIDKIHSKSAVCHPGCHLSAAPRPVWPTPKTPPVVIWNHRWEFDKQPEIFFDALSRVADKGIDFRLAILGEAYDTVPESFKTARHRFKEKIIHCGYVRDKAEYLEWLRTGSVVISTAIQENFGISIVEAVRFGCLPLVPNRLAYPEIIPANAHHLCLYDTFEDLVAKLSDILLQFSRHESLRQHLSDAMGQYDWTIRIAEFDREFARLASLPSK